MKTRTISFIISGLIGLLLAGAASAAQTAATRQNQIPAISEADLAKIQAALPKKATAKPQQARRVLVFWRCEGFFHGSGIAGGNKAIELMGAKTGAYTMDVTEDYAVFTPANLAKYDAIILNNTTRLAMNDPAQRRALLDFVRSGKGFVGIHAAADNFYDWPEGADLVGGLFDGHPWGANGTWAFKLDVPNHVLNRAFAGQGFKLQDEIYQYREPYTRADRRVLITLDLEDPTTGGITRGVKRSDKDFAVAWIKPYGQGRVFFCGFGHAMNVFQQPVMLQFFLDGLQYALGDLPADDKP